MAWSEIRTFLRDKVVSLMKNTTLGDSWLDGLYGSRDGIRLAICVAIDVASRAIEPETIADLVDTIDGRIPDARLAFAEAVDKHVKAGSFVCASRLSVAKPSYSGAYLRIVDLWEFIDYYAGPTYYYSLGLRDQRVVYRLFIADLADMKLGDIEVSWTGGKGRVWVVPLEEYLDRTSGVDEDRAATIINDALGLGRQPNSGPLGKSELLAVTYPGGFWLSCAQPTTLDASWKRSGGYYISYRDTDGWGRTQSCSGTHSPCRERVHPGFKGLTNDFSVRKIGEITDLAEDRLALLLEAYRRSPA